MTSRFGQGRRGGHLFAGALSILTACAGPSTAADRGASDEPPAVYWVMHSAEYRGAATGIFASAARALPALVEQADWTAADEQRGAALGELAAAVIVDVDETVLNNGQYQREIARRGQSYSEQSWDAWIARGEATAVPGAVAFAQAARALGVTLFYVTNRTCRARQSGGAACPQAEETRANLAAVGFPKPALQQLLLRGMKPEWTSDKASRRAHVAKRYRIVQLLGDDLADFVEGAGKADEATRNGIIDKNKDRWGHAWFLLPNPVYGSWQHGLLKAE